MRRRQRQPAPQSQEVDEYAEVKIPFDDVLRRLVSVPSVKKAQEKKDHPPKKD